MGDDNEKKVVKKKVVKKVVKRPIEEGEPRPANNDDALAAFGITETKDVSKAKMVTPVGKPTPAPVAPTPTTGDGPKKVVPKKVVKKVVKRPDQDGAVTVAPTPPAQTPKPAVEEEEDSFEVEPVEPVKDDVEVAPTVPAQTAVDDGKKGGGLRELLSTKKQHESKPEGPAAEEPDDLDIEDLVADDTKAPTKDVPQGPDSSDDLDQAEEILDDIDLDKLTKNIQEDLLETFEEKIDDILVDIIEDEDAVEELTKDDDATTNAKMSDSLGDPELDALLNESEKGPAKPPVAPTPPKSAVTKTAVAPPPKPIAPKSAATKTEVVERPEIKLEPDVKTPKKDVTLDEPVTMEKTDVKVISDTAPPKKEEPKVSPKGAETSDDTIRIEEGDVRERRVAYKVARNFDKLPTNMRNELLRNLAKVGDPKVREDVVVAIATHFKTLPPDVQALLTNLARDENTGVREEVVMEIQSNFGTISTAIRERILKAMVLDKEASVREEVVHTICQHYNDVATDVKDQLRTLAKDKVRSVREELSFEMQKSDSPVPKEVRDEILGMLKGTR